MRIQNPSELMEAMRIARDVEDAMMRTQGGYGSGFKINLSGGAINGNRDEIGIQ